MTPKVELIFDRSCPHVNVARDHIRTALTRAGLTAAWTEWDRAAPETPQYAQRYASPSVLVSGLDVAGADPLDGAAGCRIYRDDLGTRVPAPTEHMILTALHAAKAMSE